MFKKLYLFLTLLTAFLWLGSGTMWGAQSLPYSYGFETDLLELEDGWTKYFGTSLTSNNNECGIYGVAKKTGSYGFRFSSYNAQGTNAQYLISPEFEAPTGIDLTFYYATSANSQESFAVGYSTTDADVSSFTWGTTITNASTTWSKYENSFPSGTKYIAIYYFSSYKWRLYVDDFTYAVGADAPVTCPAPTALTKGAVTTTSATFTWTAGGGTNETDWQYVCLPAADDVDWSNAGVKTATSETATVTGLTENTNYKFWVRSNCGSTDGYSAEVSETFKTPCVGADVSSGWSESFTGLTAGSGIIPDCWNSVTYTYSSTTYPCIDGSEASDGDSRSLAFYGGTSTTTVYAILPPFEQAIKNLFISFDYKNGSTSTWYPQQFSVGYVTNPKDMSTYVNVQTFAQSTSFISTDDVNFPNTVPLTATNIVIRYAGNQTYSTSGYVDNIKVGVQSSCAKPTGLTASAASATSINLSWAAGSDETKWNAQYRIGAGEWTAVNDIETTVDGTNCTATLTGLTEQTTYEIQVQADCSGSTSNWSNSASETTPCAAVDGIGYTEGFDEVTVGSGNIPACWSAIQYASSYTYPYVNNQSYYAINSASDKVKYLMMYGGTSSSEQIAILPPFTNTADLYVTFNYKYAYTGSYGALQVGYITNPKDKTSFTSLQTLTITDAVTKAEVAMTGAPAGSYVAIRFGGGSSSGTVSVDDIAITAIPSCSKPTDVEGEATAYNQASISWTSDASEWKLQYSADNGENWTDANSGNSITANPYTLTGLEGNTSYIVRVKAVCGEDESDWSANSAAFPTPCAPADASDYSETFESAATGSGKLPDCWDYIQSYVYYGTTIYPYVYGSNAYAGSKALYLYGGVTGTSEQIVRLPELDEDINTLTIEFYYKASESSYSIYAKPIVGFIQADGTTFVAIETLDYAASYTKYKKALSDADADAKYIAIKYAGGASSPGSAYIDNVRVYPTPTCVEPTDVSVDEDDVTATTAIVSWTENNSATAWKLQYRTESGSWGDAINVTTNPYTLEGLTPNNVYYARVMTDCGSGDESAWSEESNDFHTDCATISSFPWNENFESQTADAVPTCWDNSASTASGSIHHKWGVYSYGGNKMIRMNNYNVGQTNGTAILISQKIAIPNDGKEYQLTFDYTNNSSAGAFTVKISKDAGANWADADSYATGSGTSYTDPGEFTKATISLADYAGETIILQFYSLANYGNGAIFVDNLKIDEAPSCIAPTALAVSEIGTNSAKVTWESEASEFALEYKKTSDEDWTAATGEIASPFVLSGLAANETEYTVRVQAICGETPSEWIELAQPFKTDCENKAVTDNESTTWGEDFEDQTVGSLPSCWAAISGASEVVVSSTGGKTAAASLQFKGVAPLVALPTIDADVKDVKVTLSANCGYYSATKYGKVAIGYIVGEEFTEVDRLDKVESTYVTKTVDMPKTAPTTARLALKIVDATENGTFYIDDIKVIRKPACAVPTITAANATSDGAVVTWTPGDEENQWNLRYSVKDADTWTVLENKTSGFALTGLTVGTTYEVQVQAYCDELHQSAWSASTEFELVCNAPSALAVTARTQNSATFSWTSSETAWKLQYKAEGDADWTEENVTTKPFTLDNLAAGTNYQAQIQSACGSAFSNVVEFTTWCDSKLSLPVDLTSFSAVPACWEVSPAGAVSIASSKLCFVGEGERFLYLPQSNINLNLLSVTLTFSGSLELGYIDEPNGEFHAFASQPTSGEELNLEDEADAPKYIAIRYNGASYLSTASISAIAIRKTPGCLAPTGVDATPSVGGASISWTNGGSEEAWNLQYKLASAADWTTVAVTENPYELSGLEQGVSYKVRVQAACAGEDPSDWSDEAEFTTNCASIGELPWFADFSVALSNCWTIHAESSSSYYIPAANTSMNQLKMDGGKNGSSNNVVVLPAFSADLSDAVLSLEYKNGATGASYAKLEIGYVTDKTDASTFAIIGEACEQTTSFTEVRVALADVTSGRQIALRFAGADSHSDMSIKNMRILEQVTLADNADNSSTLSALNGKAIDVTIGRKILRKGYYNTICLPFDLSAEEFATSPIASDDLWAFKYAKVDEVTDELLFRIIEADHIEAGVPYFIGFAADNDEDESNDTIINPLFKNVTISATAGQEVGNEVAQLCGIIDQPVVFNAGDQTKLFLAANNTLYWWNGDAASQLNNFRAYFKVATSGGGNSAPRHGMAARIIKEDQTATGIDNSKVENITIKRLENNQVVIIRNGVKYNIQGQVIQ